MLSSAVLFWTFAAVAVVSALLTITRRNAVYSALFLVLCFFSIAGLYVLLNAQFIAAVQVIVYAGAIMVLFLFVIMLLNGGSCPEEDKGGGAQSVFGWLFGVILGLSLAYLTMGLKLASLAKDAQIPQDAIIKAGNSEVVAKILYTRYIYPFEAVSVLLLIAIIGAVIISKKKL